MTQNLKDILSTYVRDYQDFPKPGVLFKDLMPLYASAEARSQLKTYLMNSYDANDFDVIAGIDARGFVLATLMADCWRKRLVLIRKHGKLPGPTYRKSYHLEYAFAGLEIQQDAFSGNERVFIVDDILATGGTLSAAAHLVKEAGASVFKMFTLMELTALKGRDHLKGYELDSLMSC